MNLPTTKVSLQLGLMFVLFSGAVLLAGYITHELFIEEEDKFDKAVIYMLDNGLVNSCLTSIAIAITACGSFYILASGYIALVLFYSNKREYNRAKAVLLTGLSGAGVTWLLKLSFARPRPPYPLIHGAAGFSFPSGHAASGFIFYGLLAYLAWHSRRPWKLKLFVSIFLLIFSLLIGISRIYLKMHFFSDVIAGFCFGYIWLFICVTMFKSLNPNTPFKLKP